MTIVLTTPFTAFFAFFLTFPVAFYRDLRASETAGSAGRDDGAASPSP